ncbi:MAG TPA: nucleoside triphosphate pyrophosphohydrolase family protein [Saprospiraceae bacterium]|nr:nucleoside triphosphate pyrophosphohydrolase family protein [Saprospiraceae bacterium]MCB9269348.1 nucleoside triphosphate pyrophosphohydrolase family protein [Lewinellaceae bacterium]HPG08897.1 nucleoside triphosphate pyrophosphohydrolase family protein [Saprospiraceae bacterium]HQU54420.1 nucleoside triphosphate pyrophosphohydrolase family protein [Saprospiraceae bacterium]HRV85488.1 nucleoside triphosphate pyrophosphohydrolase family protein [Saprospiraceae bacterium]
MELFEEPQALNDVRAFHHTFDLPVVAEPSIPSPQRCNLRVNLLEEELRELKDAIDSQDLVGIADALCDLQYVLSGAVLEFGLGERFHRLFSEVQRSNMSKRCLTMEEAQQTQEHYRAKDGTESIVVAKDEAYLVYRREDHKVLKSVNYSPADLESLIPDHKSRP